MKNEYGEPLDKNGYASSVFPQTCCYYASERSCTGTDLVRHEVYHHDQGGATRAMSKRYGAWVTLCPVHHGYVHNFPQMTKELQREAQRRVMARYGWSEEDFRKRFAKNYL